MLYLGLLLPKAAVILENFIRQLSKKTLKFSHTKNFKFTVLLRNIWTWKGWIRLDSFGWAQPNVYNIVFSSEMISFILPNCLERWMKIDTIQKINQLFRQFIRLFSYLHFQSPFSSKEKMLSHRKESSLHLLSQLSTKFTLAQWCMNYVFRILEFDYIYNINI